MTIGKLFALLVILQTLQVKCSYFESQKLKRIVISSSGEFLVACPSQRNVNILDVHSIGSEDESCDTNKILLAFKSRCNGQEDCNFYLHPELVEGDCYLSPKHRFSVLYQCEQVHDIPFKRGLPNLQERDYLQPKKVKGPFELAQGYRDIILKRQAIEESKLNALNLVYPRGAAEDTALQEPNKDVGEQKQEAESEASNSGSNEKLTEEKKDEKSKEAEGKPEGEKKSESSKENEGKPVSSVSTGAEKLNETKKDESSKESEGKPVSGVDSAAEEQPDKEEKKKSLKKTKGKLVSSRSRKHHGKADKDNVELETAKVLLGYKEKGPVKEDQYLEMFDLLNNMYYKVEDYEDEALSFQNKWRRKYVIRQIEKWKLQFEHVMRRILVKSVDKKTLHTMDLMIKEFNVITDIMKQESKQRLLYHAPLPQAHFLSRSRRSTNTQQVPVESYEGAGPSSSSVGLPSKIFLKGLPKRKNKVNKEEDKSDQGKYDDEMDKNLENRKKFRQLLTGRARKLSSRPSNRKMKTNRKITEQEKRHLGEISLLHDRLNGMDSMFHKSVASPEDETFYINNGRMSITDSVEGHSFGRPDGQGLETPDSETHNAVKLYEILDHVNNMYIKIEEIDSQAYIVKDSWQRTYLLARITKWKNDYARLMDHALKQEVGLKESEQISVYLAKEFNEISTTFHEAKDKIDPIELPPRSQGFSKRHIRSADATDFITNLLQGKLPVKMRFAITKGTRDTKSDAANFDKVLPAENPEALKDLSQAASGYNTLAYLPKGSAFQTYDYPDLNSDSFSVGISKKRQPVNKRRSNHKSQQPKKKKKKGKKKKKKGESKKVNNQPVGKNNLQSGNGYPNAGRQFNFDPRFFRNQQVNRNWAMLNTMQQIGAPASLKNPSYQVQQLQTAEKNATQKPAIIGITIKTYPSSRLREAVKQMELQKAAVKLGEPKKKNYTKLAKKKSRKLGGKKKQKCTSKSSKRCRKGKKGAKKVKGKIKTCIRRKKGNKKLTKCVKVKKPRKKLKKSNAPLCRNAKQVIKRQCVKICKKKKKRRKCKKKCRNVKGKEKQRCRTKSGEMGTQKKIGGIKQTERKSKKLGKKPLNKSRKGKKMKSKKKKRKKTVSRKRTRTRKGKIKKMLKKTKQMRKDLLGKHQKGNMKTLQRQLSKKGRKSKRKKLRKKKKRRQKKITKKMTIKKSGKVKKFSKKAKQLRKRKFKKAKSGKKKKLQKKGKRRKKGKGRKGKYQSLLKKRKKKKGQIKRRGRKSKGKKQKLSKNMKKVKQKKGRGRKGKKSKLRRKKKKPKRKLVRIIKKKKLTKIRHTPRKKIKKRKKGRKKKQNVKSKRNNKKKRGKKGKRLKKNMGRKMSLKKRGKGKQKVLISKNRKDSKVKKKNLQKKKRRSKIKKNKNLIKPKGKKIKKVWRKKTTKIHKKSKKKRNRKNRKKKNYKGKKNVQKISRKTKNGKLKKITKHRRIVKPSRTRKRGRTSEENKMKPMKKRGGGKPKLSRKKIIKKKIRKNKKKSKSKNQQKTITQMKRSEGKPKILKKKIIKKKIRKNKKKIKSKNRQKKRDKGKPKILRKKIIKKKIRKNKKKIKRKKTIRNSQKRKKEKKVVKRIHKMKKKLGPSYRGREMDSKESAPEGDPTSIQRDRKQDEQVIDAKRRKKVTSGRIVSPVKQLPNQIYPAAQQMDNRNYAKAYNQQPKSITGQKKLRKITYTNPLFKKSHVVTPVPTGRKKVNNDSKVSKQGKKHRKKSKSRSKKVDREKGKSRQKKRNSKRKSKRRKSNRKKRRITDTLQLASNKENFRGHMPLHKIEDDIKRNAHNYIDSQKPMRSKSSKRNSPILQNPSVFMQNQNFGKSAGGSLRARRHNLPIDVRTPQKRASKKSVDGNLIIIQPPVKVEKYNKLSSDMKANIRKYMCHQMTHKQRKKCLRKERERRKKTQKRKVKKRLGSYCTGLKGKKLRRCRRKHENRKERDDEKVAITKKFCKKSKNGKTKKCLTKQKIIRRKKPKAKPVTSWKGRLCQPFKGSWKSVCLKKLTRIERSILNNEVDRWNTESCFKAMGRDRQRCLVELGRMKVLNEREVNLVPVPLVQVGYCDHLTGESRENCLNKGKIVRKMKKKPKKNKSLCDNLFGVTKIQCLQNKFRTLSKVTQKVQVTPTRIGSIKTLFKKENSKARPFMMKAKEDQRLKLVAQNEMNPLSGTTFHFTKPDILLQRKCFPNPCLNGGHCEEYDGQAICTCRSNFVGNKCELEIQACHGDNPCQHGGRCVTLMGLLKCLCPPPFYGSLCQEPKDSCGRDCQNNGICLESDAGPVCKCAAGFSGDLCQEPIDECESEPCKHYGTCVDLTYGFSCLCSEDFTGDMCEVYIGDPSLPPQLNPCDSLPCQHHAQCVPNTATGTFVCVCTDEFTGTFCQHPRPMDACASNPCLNAGRCMQLSQSYVCLCEHDYTGDRCEILNKVVVARDHVHVDGKDVVARDELEYNTKDIVARDETGLDNKNVIAHDQLEYKAVAASHDQQKLNNKVMIASNQVQQLSDNKGMVSREQLGPCSVHPCLNGGECLALGGIDYKCNCHGYFGVNCEIPNPCIKNPCAGSEICEAKSDGSYQCVCNNPNGCGVQVVVQSCSRNPCKNNGQCRMAADSTVRCICLKGFTGLHCEIAIESPCDSLECQHGGSCIDYFDVGDYTKFSCNCVEGYTGLFCEAGPDEDFCRFQPCQNNGICENLHDGYKCICPANYRGSICQDYNDPCANSPCRANETCTYDSSSPGFYRCDGLSNIHPAPFIEVDIKNSGINKEPGKTKRLYIGVFVFATFLVVLLITVAICFWCQEKYNGSSTISLPRFPNRTKSNRKSMGDFTSVSKLDSNMHNNNNIEESDSSENAPATQPLLSRNQKKDKSGGKKSNKKQNNPFLRTGTAAVLNSDLSE